MVHPISQRSLCYNCFKARDEPLLSHVSTNGHLEEHHYLFPYVCDGIAVMIQGLQARQRWASRTPLVAWIYLLLGTYFLSLFPGWLTDAPHFLLPHQAPNTLKNEKEGHMRPRKGVPSSLWDLTLFCGSLNYFLDAPQSNFPFSLNLFWYPRAPSTFVNLLP